MRRRKKRTGECNIKSGRTHCTFHQYSFTIRVVCHGARARRAYLCGRDVRAPRRRLGERDPRTWLSLMRARRPRTQAALGRARRVRSQGATRGGRCVNDLRAVFQDAPGCCAREPMTARCRTWGARHAVPLLIRHRNDDMWRSGRNALHLQETFSDVVKTDKTGLSKTAHTRWMISAFANFLPGSTIFRLA